MAATVGMRARQGVNLLFAKAARAQLVADPADAIEIAPLSDTRIVELPEQRMLVLTISSYLFRLLTLIHYSPGRATEAYFNRSDQGRTLDESIGEVGNLCCGAMKRELGGHFMHLGMSTPTILDNRCMGFLDALKPAYVSQHRIRIADRVDLHATLCLCAYGDLDFHIVEASAHEDTGALELF